MQCMADEGGGGGGGWRTRVGGGGGGVIERIVLWPLITVKNLNNMSSKCITDLNH